MPPTELKLWCRKPLAVTVREGLHMSSKGLVRKEWGGGENCLVVLHSLFSRYIVRGQNK